MAETAVGKKRDKHINMRFTPDEYEEIESFVGNRNRSEVLRRLILRAARANRPDEG